MSTTARPSPNVMDSKQKPIGDEVRIGSGTTMRCGVEVRPWYVASQGVGVSLRLRVVQVIDLVEFGGGGASGFDFEDEEGFESVAAAMDEHEGDDLEGMM